MADVGARMLQRRGSAAEWAATNPILGDGEIGYDRDTGQIRLGNGTEVWNDLPRIINSDGGTFDGEVDFNANIGLKLGHGVRFYSPDNEAWATLNWDVLTQNGIASNYPLRVTGNITVDRANSGGNTVSVSKIGIGSWGVLQDRNVSGDTTGSESYRSMWLYNSYISDMPTNTYQQFNPWGEKFKIELGNGKVSIGWRAAAAGENDVWNDGGWSEPFKVSKDGSVELRGVGSGIVLHGRDNDTQSWVWWVNANVTRLFSNTGNVDAFMLDATGRGIFRAAVVAGDPATSGQVVLHGGDGAHSGYVEFWQPNGNRAGYIGYAPNGASSDQGQFLYQAGLHNFAGPVNMSSELGIYNVPIVIYSSSSVLKGRITVTDIAQYFQVADELRITAPFTDTWMPLKAGAVYDNNARVYSPNNPAPGDTLTAFLIDAKGDLIVGTADNAAARLARGTTGQVLAVQADGSLGWQAGGGGAVINQTIRGTVTLGTTQLVMSPSLYGSAVTIPSVNMAKSQLRNNGFRTAQSFTTTTGPSRSFVTMEIHDPITLWVGTSDSGSATSAVYEITEWT